MKAKKIQQIRELVNSEQKRKKVFRFNADKIFLYYAEINESEFKKQYSPKTDLMLFTDSIYLDKYSKLGWSILCPSGSNTDILILELYTNRHDLSSFTTEELERGLELVNKYNI